MRQFFMMLIGGGAVLATVGFGVYLVLRALYSVFSDWRLQKELAEISADSKARRERRQEDTRKRLDTGCDHSFEGAIGGFPPGTCEKCGMEKVKPAGMCDHRWKRGDGPTPWSYCEKCGKEFRAAPMPQGFSG